MPYAELVGTLLYLSTCSRTDITHAVSQLTRFISAPTKQHWNEALGVVRFVAGTIDYGLVFICVLAITQRRGAQQLLRL
eukprot:64871-Chlamydomonas_euryale.AAC.1